MHFMTWEFYICHKGNEPFLAFKRNVLTWYLSQKFGSTGYKSRWRSLWIFFSPISSILCKNTPRWCCFPFSHPFSILCGLSLSIGHGIIPIFCLIAERRAFFVCPILLGPPTLLGTPRCMRMKLLVLFNSSHLCWIYIKICTDSHFWEFHKINFGGWPKSILMCWDT